MCCLALSRSSKKLVEKAKNKRRKSWEHGCVGRGRIFTIQKSFQNYCSQKGVCSFLKKQRKNGSVKDKKTSGRKTTRQDSILVKMSKFHVKLLVRLKQRGDVYGVHLNIVEEEAVAYSSTQPGLTRVCQRTISG